MWSHLPYVETWLQTLENGIESAGRSVLYLHRHVHVLPHGDCDPYVDVFRLPHGHHAFSRHWQCWLESGCQLHFPEAPEFQIRHIDEFYAHRYCLSDHEHHKKYLRFLDADFPQQLSQ
ncbi:hypothetical protein D3C86_1683100 [compost metagenome]